MRIIRVFSIAILLVFTYTLTFAQDPSVNEILVACSKKVHQLKNVEIKFEYSISTMDSKSKELYQGEFIVKGIKYKMTIDETVTYSNGSTRWVYLVESNEVNVSDVIKDEELELEEQFLNDPLSIYDLYNKDFKVRLNGTGEMDDLKIFEIDLTPNDLNKPYFKLRYLITEENDLYSIQYFQKDGTKILLRIKSVVEGQKFKDAAFNFNVANYPDVEVIDLR